MVTGVPMKATIIEVTRDYQVCQDEAGFWYRLEGIARVPQAKVGDTGTMEYKRGNGWGLWFFKADNPKFAVTA